MAAVTSMTYKIPESVLVVIYTPSGQVLLIRRADAGTWQSVTGSKDSPEENWADTAMREVLEETGIDARHPPYHLQDWHLENVYDIYPAWRWRYHPQVSRNTERLFGLSVPDQTPITLSSTEHTEWQWLPWQVAANHCFSASNAEAILMLPHFENQIGL
ncbi:MAG: dihydroneopterin triphosphate diphosphatase [Limnohabitans sp.]|jgi:dATP pyrophosphohydrolase|nr:dihydroneopterin triphosphate diphosphatase [Limnohabitans sp.]